MSFLSIDRDFDWDKLNLNQIDGNSKRLKPKDSAIYQVTVTMTGVASNCIKLVIEINYAILTLFITSRLMADEALLRLERYYSDDSSIDFVLSGKRRQTIAIESTEN